MAKFYDTQPTNDPNYLGMSKEPDRVPANKGLGELFEGIGNLIGVTVKAADSRIKQGIMDDAHKMVDQVQSEHGIDMSLDDVRAIAGTGAKGRVRALQMREGGLSGDTPTSDTGDQALGYAPEDARRDAAINSIFPVNDKRPLPPQAAKEVSQLQRFQQAYYSGDLSDSYYNAQLLSVAKKLRFQYPGYRDEVDHAISQITGVQPANALRASLMRDVQYNLNAQLANASDEKKFRDKYRGIIASGGYDPDNTPMETIRPFVNDQLGQKYSFEASALRVNAGSPEAESLLSTRLGKIVTDSLVASANKTQGGSSLANFIERARAASTTGLDPKAKAALLQDMELKRNELATVLRNTAYLPIEGDKEGRTLVGKVKDGDTKLASIITAQLKPWDDAINMVKSDAYSALAISTDALKYRDNRLVQNLRENFPGADQMSAIVAAFPNNPLLQNQFLQHSKILPEFTSAIKQGLGNAILTGKPNQPAPTPSQAVNHYGKNLNSAQQGAAAKQTADQYDIVISDKNTNTENAAHVAKQFFTDTKFYDNLSDDGRMKLFIQMAAPSKTAFLKTLADKDPEVMQKYQEWAQYAAADIWRRSSDNLQAAMSDPRFNMSFDLKGMRFVDHTVYNIDTTDQRTKAANTRAINAVNNAITYLRPIVGDDPLSILPALGVNPQTLKEDGIAQKVLRSVGSRLVTGSELKEGLLKGFDDFREKLGIDEGTTTRRDLKEGNTNPR